MNNTIKIHVLDQEKVKDSVEKSCIEIKRIRDQNNDWLKNYLLKEWNENPPENLEEEKEKFEVQVKEREKIFDNMCDEERNYYSKVCIVEDVSNQKFYLNYEGGEKAEGTGAFDTLEKAESWFFNQGR